MRLQLVTLNVNLSLWFFQEVCGFFIHWTRKREQMLNFLPIFQFFDLQTIILSIETKDVFSLLEQEYLYESDQPIS